MHTQVRQTIGLWARFDVRTINARKFSPELVFDGT
jgi:hypothetical protein